MLNYGLNLFILSSKFFGPGLQVYSSAYATGLREYANLDLFVYISLSLSLFLCNCPSVSVLLCVCLFLVLWSNRCKRGPISRWSAESVNWSIEETYIYSGNKPTAECLFNQIKIHRISRRHRTKGFHKKNEKPRLWRQQAFLLITQQFIKFPFLPITFVQSILLCLGI